MGLPKGKTNNRNGRPKGRPNHLTGELKSWIQALVEKNQGKFERDLKKLDPEKRLMILEKLMQYVVPKMQTVSIEEQIKFEYENLERLLNSAPDEAIDVIFEKIKNLKDGKGEEN